MAVEPEQRRAQSEASDRSQYRWDDVADRQKLTTRSWQVGSIPETTQDPGSRTFFGMTQNKRAQVVINVYPPGRRDEMHCHPGSEHTFLVWEGQLTVRGINDREEITLGPGDFLHVNAGHYYQLCNDTSERLVLYQVATRPLKPPPVERRSFRRAGEVRPEDVNGRGLPPGVAAPTPHL